MEDESGDLKIDYNKWRKLNFKYGIAYLNRDGLGYTETEIYLDDWRCIEELKFILRAAKAKGYKN